MSSLTSCSRSSFILPRLLDFNVNTNFDLRDGNDGPWSTFTLGFGTPPQYVRVLISLTIVQPWVVVPQGCIPTDPLDCSSHRGSLFYANESDTWQHQGLFTLVFEDNLGYNDNGDFGFDTMSLGLLGSGAPTVKHQIIAGIAAKDFT